MKEMLSATDTDERLAQVLDDYLAAVAQGVAPSRDSLFEQHPDLAGELRTCLASLDFIRRGAAKAVLAAPASGLLSGTADATIGDYRLVRELGRGGMGTVYEAVQLSLGRHVALKVLPHAAALDPKQLQRFQNEAQAAAQLHHPSIVPVYAVGCERGLHYYVMQRIEGQSLADFIRDLRRHPSRPETFQNLSTTITTAPSASTVSVFEEREEPHSCPLIQNRAYIRQAAGFALQAAEALERAHQEGIVHRDVKPANLLLEPSGHLWITDFGLAYLPNNLSLTDSGDLVGTLRYMSPEQAAGQRALLDHRTDIYSLGATLYELLTLRPLFESSDRQVLLTQIAAHDPCLPRRWNPRIPRDLETIILKATAKSPQERYVSAQELADDLRRFLNDEPIQARRPSLLDRAWKWSQRHRPLVSAGILFLALLTATTSVTAVIVVRQKSEVEQRRRQSRTVVDEMYTAFALKWLYQQPHLEPLQREFLQKALDFYESFANETGPDLAAQFEAARARRRVGEIQSRLGHLDQAGNCFDQAIGELARLVEKSPAEPRFREELANCLNQRGSWLRDRHEAQAATRAYRDAQLLFAQLAHEHRDIAPYREGLAGTTNNLAMTMQALGQSEQAEKSYRQAQAVFDQLVAADPDSPSYCHSLATCRNNLGNLLRQMGRLDEARALLESAVELGNQLHVAYPGLPLFRHSLAAMCHGHGLVLGALGRQAAAEAALVRAVEIREKLAVDFPQSPAYRQAWATSLVQLGQVRTAAGRYREAEKAYLGAVKLCQELKAGFPAQAIYQQELSAAYQGLGALYTTWGQPQKAAAALREVAIVMEGEEMP